MPTTFQSRDARFLGTIGYFDALALPLHEGWSTVWFVVIENCGGWGVQARFLGVDGIECGSCIKHQRRIWMPGQCGGASSPWVCKSCWMRSSSSVTAASATCAMSSPATTGAPTETNADGFV